MTAQSFVDTLRGFFDRGKATSLDEHLEGEEGLWRIWRNSSKDDSDWAIYLKSDLDLDTDGPRSRGIKYDVTHQDETSLRWADGSSVNSNTVPFVVIPGYWQRGIVLGDSCLVQYKDKLVQAIVADIGPRRKIGEGSIALHRALGIERVVGGRIQDVGIGSGVRTIFFPNSGNGKCQTNSDVMGIALDRWRALTETTPRTEP